MLARARSGSSPASVTAVVFWACEYVYNQAWRGVLAKAAQGSAYREAAERCGGSRVGDVQGTRRRRAWGRRRVPAPVLIHWAGTACLQKLQRDRLSTLPSVPGCARRWGSEGFAAYVGALSTVVDGVLAEAGEEELAAVRAAVDEVVRMENDFWQMALDGGSA